MHYITALNALHYCTLHVIIMLSTRYVCPYTQDVFYLTMEELFAFVDGRSVTNNLSELAELRKKEFDGYRKVRVAGQIPETY